MKFNEVKVNDEILEAMVLIQKSERVFAESVKKLKEGKGTFFSEAVDDFYDGLGKCMESMKIILADCLESDLIEATE